jgi:hypothetical protein
MANLSFFTGFILFYKKTVRVLNQDGFEGCMCYSYLIIAEQATLARISCRLRAKSSTPWYNQSFSKYVFLVSSSPPIDHSSVVKISNVFHSHQSAVKLPISPL